MHLGESYSVPNHVVQAIRQYDPLVRLRWGRAKRRVRLERKIDRARPADPAYFSQDPDGYDMAREGYTLISSFEPDETAYRLIVQRLWEADIRRRGGWRKVADEMDEADIAARRKADTAVSDENHARAVDLWNHMNTVKVAPEGAGHRPYLGNGRGAAL